MALPARDDTAWTAIVAGAAETQMTGVISIYNPSAPATPYDGVTDTGGYTGPAVVLSDVPARAVLIRRPQEFKSEIDWTTDRPVRVQIPRRYFGTPILAGYVIRFTDGGDDANLLNISLEVLSAANGTLAAVRTIECRSSLAVTPPVT